MSALLLLVWGLMTACTVANTGNRLFLRVSEVAELLEVDPRTVRRAIDENDLPAVRVGQTIRIPAAEFFAWARLTPDSSEAGPASPATASPLRPSDQPEGAHHDGDPDTTATASNALRVVSGD